MKITECIILAGGLGTRLRSAVPDLPKCMAPVAGKPFIHHIIFNLQQQGIERFVLALGYMHEAITSYVESAFPELDIAYSIENEPLGTGGAIRLACKSCTEDNVIVFNGDTMFKIDVQKLSAFHLAQNADCTLSLKPMKDFDRYGVVETDDEGHIMSFLEKNKFEKGLINGGVYALNVISFLKLDLPNQFSFEKDYLEKYFSSQKMMGLVQDAYFIDIGIPEDYEKANRDNEFKTSTRKLPLIDPSWTLFLDRDGVINHEKHEDYIHTWDEFKFYDGVVDALAAFRKLFKRIIIVTNQRGVGRGLTKMENLELIHSNMLRAFTEAGGEVDAVFFCPDVDSDHPDRKPNPGMGLKAQLQFPDIDFKRSIMVGNTLSDMKFGRNIGAYNVFLSTTRPEVSHDDPNIDMVYESLIEFANALQEQHTK